MSSPHLPNNILNLWSPAPTLRPRESNVRLLDSLYVATLWPLPSSITPETSRPIALPLPSVISFDINWWALLDSNQQSTTYEVAASTIKLRARKKIGAPAGTRTPDQCVKSALLYQLSYRSGKWCIRRDSNPRQEL